MSDISDSPLGPELSNPTSTVEEGEVVPETQSNHRSEATGLNIVADYVSDVSSVDLSGPEDGECDSDPAPTASEPPPSELVILPPAQFNDDPVPISPPDLPSRRILSPAAEIINSPEVSPIESEDEPLPLALEEEDDPEEGEAPVENAVAGPPESHSPEMNRHHSPAPRVPRNPLADFRTESVSPVPLTSSGHHKNGRSKKKKSKKEKKKSKKKKRKHHDPGHTTTNAASPLGSPVSSDNNDFGPGLGAPSPVSSPEIHHARRVSRPLAGEPPYVLDQDEDHDLPETGAYRRSKSQSNGRSISPETGSHYRRRPPRTPPEPIDSDSRHSYRSGAKTPVYGDSKPPSPPEPYPGDEDQCPGGSPPGGPAGGGPRTPPMMPAGPRTPPSETPPGSPYPGSRNSKRRRSPPPLDDMDLTPPKRSRRSRDRSRDRRRKRSPDRYRSPG